VHADPLAAAEHNAHAWLADVAEALGTDDRRRAQRILRAWLHLVRDRLPNSGAVHFGAQLPEMLRGVYFEDWVPGRPPDRSTGAQFLDDFARTARLSPDEAATALTTVTSVLRERFSPGQMDHALVLLPRTVRSALSPEPVPAAAHSGS
jgi:uncharacterized protein (DUF2267 family)